MEYERDGEPFVIGVFGTVPKSELEELEIGGRAEII